MHTHHPLHFACLYRSNSRAKIPNAVLVDDWVIKFVNLQMVQQVLNVKYGNISLDQEMRRRKGDRHTKKIVIVRQILSNFTSTTSVFFHFDERNVDVNINMWTSYWVTLVPWHCYNPTWKSSALQRSVLLEHDLWFHRHRRSKPLLSTADETFQMAHSCTGGDFSHRVVISPMSCFIQRRLTSGLLIKTAFALEREGGGWCLVFKKTLKCRLGF